MDKNEAIQKFLHPESIAIVGVSKDFTSISGKPIKNLIQHQYKGNIYPVNPKYEEIGGYKCYPSLVEIPDSVDVALIAVSAKRMLSIIDQCKQKAIRSIVLFGSGFAEIGEEGSNLQNEVLEKAKEANIHILGPNCVGLLNVHLSLPMGFATSFETDRPFISGPVGFASQSGAIGFSLFGMAQEENIGFSYVVNTGNQMDITTLDVMSYMVKDEQTSIITGYLESIPDGEQFIRLAKAAKEKDKPLIMLKAGRSKLGQKAALSHTASMTGSDETYQAIAKQYGIITVNDIDDLITTVKVFLNHKRAAGNRVVTISNSGAAGIAMADYSEDLQLNMITLAEETKRKVADLIPTYGSAMNPIDVTAQSLKEQHILTDTLKILLEDTTIDSIVFQTTFGGELGFNICKAIAEIDAKTDKPILVTITGTDELTGKGRRYLQQNKIPVYKTSYETMVALSVLVQYSTKTVNDVQVAGENIYHRDEIKERIWTEVKVKHLLTSFGIRTPKGVLINKVDEIETMKVDWDIPKVCKVISSDILHKTDAGGVIVNIQNEQELALAVKEITESVKKYDKEAQIDGFLVEEMVKQEGVEFFIGVKEDPQFGAIIVCGLGGIFIEVFKDVSLRKAPVSEEDAIEMLMELKGYAVLQGVRGKGSHDIQALARAIEKISHFAANQNGRLKEMDINPLLVLEEGEGVLALDGVIVWDEKIDHLIESL